MTHVNAPDPSAPTQVDLRALARSGAPLSGELPLAALERLASDLPEWPSPALVRWQAQAEFRATNPALATPPERGAQAQPLWLRLTLQAEVPQTCQRCLQPYAESVEVDRWFRFVADEATAEAQDDEAEEDLLVFQPRFNLLELLEDELLMALPLVPMHEVCPTDVPMRAGDLADGDSGRPNPFAALAALKDPSGGTGA